MAYRWCERTRAACWPPQLLSEEYDPHQHQMRGNLPQAFGHALMIESAARLPGAALSSRAMPAVG
jgi:GH15 family glucan-1,4-alpha-glucosidase